MILSWKQTGWPSVAFPVAKGPKDRERCSPDGLNVEECGLSLALAEEWLAHQAGKDRYEVSRGEGGLERPPKGSGGQLGLASAEVANTPGQMPDELRE